MASEIKISSKGEPQLERVLIVDPVAANARLLGELLRNLSLCQISHAVNDMRGLALARDTDPQMIFVELSSSGVDGLEFTRRLRRSDFGCREVPVVMITAEATAASILAARDAGMHEFLRRPFNMADLRKRIDAVALRKRDWVEAVSYVGPDRRRFNSADYTGPQKRQADQVAPAAQRISQALRIVKAAVDAIESDPKQAFRALKAQADALSAVSAADIELKPLADATVSLQTYLAQALKAGRMTREPLERLGQALLTAAPEDARPSDTPRKTAAA